MSETNVDNFIIQAVIEGYKAANVKPSDITVHMLRGDISYAILVLQRLLQEINQLAMAEGELQRVKLALEGIRVNGEGTVVASPHWVNYDSLQGHDRTMYFLSANAGLEWCRTVAKKEGYFILEASFKIPDMLLLEAAQEWFNQNEPNTPPKLQAKFMLTQVEGHDIAEQMHKDLASHPDYSYNDLEHAVRDIAELAEG